MIVNVIVKILNFNDQRKGKARSHMLTSRRLDLARVAPVAKFSDHSILKILSPKKMLQGLLIALAQVKAVNTLGSLLNKIK